MPTLREMAEKAHELEQKILVYNWLEIQLRSMVDGKTELRLEDKPVAHEIVDVVMADVLDHRELAQQELKSFWEQPITVGTAKEPEKEEFHEPPALEDPPEPRRAQSRRKG